MKRLKWADEIIEKYMLSMVAKGDKIGCYKSGRSVPTRAKKFGLDCEPALLVCGPGDTYAVARRCTVASVIPDLIIPDLRGRVIRRRLNQLIDKVENMSIAKALSYLDSYPRVDEYYPRVNTGNLERPEIAVLQGLLLSYAACCVEYYINTRYLGFDESVVSTTPTPKELGPAQRMCNHVHCPECQKRIREKKYR